MPGATNDREVIRQAVAGCDGVLTVLVPWGVQQYSSGTAQAVLDFAEPGARLIFSSGWHITRDGPSGVCIPGNCGSSWPCLAGLHGSSALSTSMTRSRHAGGSSPATPDGPWCVAATWRKVRARDCPVWSRHVGDPILASNLTRRIDFALLRGDRNSRTMRWSRKHPPSSAARVPRRSPRWRSVRTSRRRGGDRTRICHRAGCRGCQN